MYMIHGVVSNNFLDFCVDLSKHVSMMRDGFRFFWLLTSAAAGPLEVLKIRRCQYYMVGIICPYWLR